MNKKTILMLFGLLLTKNTILAPVPGMETIKTAWSYLSGEGYKNDSAKIIQAHLRAKNAKTLKERIEKQHYDLKKEQTTLHLQSIIRQKIARKKVNTLITTFESINTTLQHQHNEPEFLLTLATIFEDSSARLSRYLHNTSEMLMEVNNALLKVFSTKNMAPNSLPGVIKIHGNNILRLSVAAQQELNQLLGNRNSATQKLIYYDSIIKYIIHMDDNQIISLITKNAATEDLLLLATQAFNLSTSDRFLTKNQIIQSDIKPSNSLLPYLSPGALISYPVNAASGAYNLATKTFFSAKELIPKRTQQFNVNPEIKNDFQETEVDDFIVLDQTNSLQSSYSQGLSDLQTLPSQNSLATTSSSPKFFTPQSSNHSTPRPCSPTTPALYGSETGTDVEQKNSSWPGSPLTQFSKNNQDLIKGAFSIVNLCFKNWNEPINKSTMELFKNMSISYSMGVDILTKANCPETAKLFSKLSQSFKVAEEIRMKIKNTNTLKKPFLLAATPSQITKEATENLSLTVLAIREMTEKNMPKAKEVLQNYKTFLEQILKGTIANISNSQPLMNQFEGLYTPWE